MEIRHENHTTKGQFEAYEDQQQAGKMTYSWAGPDKMIIDHTEVDPGYSGKGIGKKLVTAAVEYARKNDLKILPLCPFAKKVMDKDLSTQDVRF